jgi:hypothetical protein
MADDLTAMVTIDKVEHDVGTGWYRIHVHKDDGSKFRLDTKFEDKAQEAAALMGQPNVRVWYTERPSQNINQRTGQPYPPDRWYGRAEFGAPAPTGNGGIQTIGAEVQQQVAQIPAAAPRGEDPERNWRICLQTGGKLAVATMPLMPNEQRSFDVQKQIATAWAKFFFFTPVPVWGASSEPASPQVAYENEPAAVGGGYDAPPPPSDDDIPY